MDTNELVNKLMEYYQVHTLSDLSKKLGVGQPAISKWKTNNSINTIKKKCQKLGIYTEIFDNNDNIKSVDDNNDCLFDSLTNELVKKLITKCGSEEELQHKLMLLLMENKK